MKKSIILLLLMIFFLSGCKYKIYSQEEIENKKSLVEQEFIQKEKCAKYMEKSKEDIKYYNEKNNPDISSDIIMTNGFEEVFYSKNLNTCLSVESFSFQNFKLGVDKKTYYIYDLLTNKKILEKELTKEYTKDDFMKEVENYR